MSTATGLRYAIAPIATEIADRIREKLVDDFGNQLEVCESDPVPCRHCLQISDKGQPVILFAYRPFDFSGPYAEVGPVFIHAAHCKAYGSRDRFLEAFRHRVLTMRGYNDDARIEAAELSVAGNPEASIERLFLNERVRFIHARNPAWGCYDFRIDRE